MDCAGAGGWESHSVTLTHLCRIGILLRGTGIGSKDEHFPRLENIWIFGIGETLSHRDANVASGALRTCILFIHGFWYQLHYSAITDKTPTPPKKNKKKRGIVR